MSIGRRVVQVACATVAVSTLSLGLGVGGRGAVRFVQANNRANTEMDAASATLDQAIALTGTGDYAASRRVAGASADDSQKAIDDLAAKDRALTDVALGAVGIAGAGVAIALGRRLAESPQPEEPIADIDR